MEEFSVEEEDHEMSYCWELKDEFKKPEVVVAEAVILVVKVLLVEESVSLNGSGSGAWFAKKKRCTCRRREVS